MPKSARKTAPKKKGSADFKRPKRKVGHKAPKAANHTDTRFKSGRIHVHDQSLSAANEKGEAVTRRQLSVDDLLRQMNHFGKTTRRDALHGLKELAVWHHHALKLQLSAVLAKVCVHAHTER
jgi:pre-rRNA-processing protein IPI1